MAEVAEDDRAHQESDRLWWRRRGLRKIGIDRALAAEYAAEVDYHDVEALARRTGWTVEQAFELLRP